MKNGFKYIGYLRELGEYLEGFMRRSRPLFQLKEFMDDVGRVFGEKYEEGTVHGWEP